MQTNTDHDWEQWGKNDPYFGVITDPRFRRNQLNDAERDYFFETGRIHAHYVIDMVRQRLDPQFMPRRMLDFGCGVGRVLLPSASFLELAVGVDVSASMLTEAKANCDRLGLSNVEFHCQGHLEGIPEGAFDLVHSAIVLQHIDVQRGLQVFGQLIDRIAPRGVGAIQVTYSKSHYADRMGMPPPPTPAEPAAAKPRRGLRRLLEASDAPDQQPPSEPVMQMNPYPLTALFFKLQAAAIPRVHVEFTDHGGELGVFLFFQKA